MERSNNLADIPRYQAKIRPNATALIFEGQEVSYGEFDRRTNQVANGLVERGVRPGERIVHLGKNSSQYFEMLFGAAKAGVVMVPVNWRLAPPEIEYIISDCKPRLLFVGPEFVETVKQLGLEIPTIVLENGDPQLPDFDAWRDAQSESDPAVPSADDAAVLQLYTSGTTGRPKGAILTNRSLLGLRAATPPEEVAEWNRWTENDVSLIAMPIFHIGGSGWGIQTLEHGAKGIIVREFDPNAVLDLLEQYRINKIFLVPSAMQIVVRHSKAATADFSFLKYILYGASPIPLDLLSECMQMFGCGFVQMYGMTETSGTIVALPPEDHDPKGNRRMRSAGKALPGVELAILDAEGRPHPPGAIGEIATRSVANMAGYFNMPEATAQTLTSDGWLRTGDAGLMDEDGYVYIQDRVKDMIISGGENVYPAEVENAIFGHPDVSDVAVIGVPDKKWGEAVKAVVVPKPGTSPSPADIIAWARQRIAAYKAPKSVDIVDSLPRNPSGKLLRRQIREPYWAGTDRQVH